MPSASPDETERVCGASEIDASSVSAASRVREALSQSGYVGVRHLTCESHNNIVTISGRVPSFYQKQVAIGLVLRCLEPAIVFDHDIDVADGRTG